MRRSALFALLLALGPLSLVACHHGVEGDREASARCVGTDGGAGTPVDAALLAFLSRARAAHHLADESESQGDLAAATRPLADLVAGPLPHVLRAPPAASGLAPEVREVLADTHARLADLRSRSGAFEPAEADIQAGLEQAREANYFRGHLLETAGLVEERRAHALTARDPAAAAQARQRAISLLEQAMAVQSQVIEKLPSTTPAAVASSPNNAMR